MSERFSMQRKKSVTPFQSAPPTLLLRRCACGQHTSTEDECDECKQKRENTIQRAETDSASVNEIPPVVYDVLGSSGQPLDEQTKAFMQPRFGYDFSNVRIHADERAATSAQAVHALAYTVGNNVVFGTGQYAPATTGGKQLLAHELTHVVQQQAASGENPTTVETENSSYEQEAEVVSSSLWKELAAVSASESIGDTLAAPAIQRQVAPDAPSDTPQMSLTPEFAQSLTDDQLEEQVSAERVQLSTPNVDSSLLPTIQENLNILEAEVTRRTAEGQQAYTSTRDQLLAQGPYIDPSTPLFTEYTDASKKLSTFDAPVTDEPLGILVPGDQLLTVSDTGQVQLLQDTGIAEIGDDLFPALDDFVTASQGGELQNIGGDALEQAVLWDDGRAIIAPPSSADLATIFIQGQPADVESGLVLSDLDVPWKRVRDASMQSVLTSGIYQFGSYPLSKFNGIALPPNSRIRFADPGHPFDSRLATIFEKGTKRYYAWDAHSPVGGATHDFYHINQKGMAQLFGQGNHSPLPPSRLSAAKGIRYLRIGGRVFLLIGVFVDSYQLTSSIIESAEQGTPRPAIAQAVRTIGGWGGAWAGAKLLCVGGGAATIETGPGAVLGCIAGGVVGGFAGYFAADWIADMIESN